MNPGIVLNALHARILSAELTAAAELEARPLARRIMLAWYHRATAPRSAMAGAVLVLTMMAFPSTGSSIALLALALAEYTRIANLSHEVINEENGHCPRCPAAEDDNGDGGRRIHPYGDDIPPAPGPMPELTDEQIRAMTGDLDQQMLALHNAWRDGAFR